MFAILAFAAAAAALQPAAPPAPPAPPSRLPRPAPDMGLITTADYPRESLRAREQGRVRMLIAVAPSGRVTRCNVIGSSGSSRLDAVSCRLTIERARFLPALDAAGRPIGWQREWAVSWNLPPR